MKLLAKNRRDFDACIDAEVSPQKSVVLRYRNAFELRTTPKESSDFKAWLQKTSIQEGARIFPLLTYRGVDIYILDETSLMSTKTLKSIDGCVSIALCKLRGYERVVFESGGNTGTALTEYGRRAGLETFFFCPEENVSLLNSSVFETEQAHLITVKDAGSVKKAAHLFKQMNGLKHIPESDWRYKASMFRGFFILEQMMAGNKFHWLTQTISAAFGPIGIYNVLRPFKKELGDLPRLLGIQQEGNCPMYRVWKSGRMTMEPSGMASRGPLLTKVMYDVKPQTYGTYQELRGLLLDTNGDLTTVNHSEFFDFMEQIFDGKTVLDLLQNRGIEITMKDGEIVEKTGLIALAGTLKEIDTGNIVTGSKVLCCLTSGVSDADGFSKPEYRIEDVDRATKEYSKLVFGE